MTSVIRKYVARKKILLVEHAASRVSGAQGEGPELSKASQAPPHPTGQVEKPNGITGLGVFGPHHNAVPQRLDSRSLPLSPRTTLPCTTIYYILCINFRIFSWIN